MEKKRKRAVFYAVIILFWGGESRRNQAYLIMARLDLVLLIYFRLLFRFARLGCRG